MSTPAVEAATPRRTPVFDVHRELGTRSIDFLGLERPVLGEGTLEEHRAMPERAGVLGVSQRGELEVRGREAMSVLQRLARNDVARMADEIEIRGRAARARVVETPFLSP